MRKVTVGLGKLFVILCMVAGLWVFGCDDDDDSGSSNGDDSSSVCEDCENQDDVPLCVAAYDDCIARNPNDAECAVGALALCSIF